MISERLRVLRERKGLTIKDSAAFLRISPSTYREWELGTKISGEPYIELAELFGVSLHFLISGHESSEHKESLIKDLDHVIISLQELKENVISTSASI